MPGASANKKKKTREWVPCPDSVKLDGSPDGIRSVKNQMKPSKRGAISLAPQVSLIG